MDDSTSAVDTKTDALIRQAMREEIPDTTKFIIAQRISSVQDADLILVMENGRIDACGTHEALLKSSDIYREVYDSQNKTGGGDNGYQRSSRKSARRRRPRQDGFQGTRQTHEAGLP